MRCDSKTKNTGRVYSEADYKAKSEELENPDAGYSPKKYRIFAVPQDLLSKAEFALLSHAQEEAEDEDWDEDTLKNLHPDKAVSEFLRYFFEIYRYKPSYRVTVEVEVEAEDEDDAEQMVKDDLRCFYSWEVTGAEEV